MLGETTTAGSLGYQMTATAHLVWPAAPGLVTITAVIDPQGVVSETNKGNNAASLLLGEMPAPSGLSAAGHAADRSVTLLWTPPGVAGVAAIASIGRRGAVDHSTWLACP